MSNGKLLSVILLLSSLSWAVASATERFSNTVERTFPVGQTPQLKVRNAYGPISIQVWNTSTESG